MRESINEKLNSGASYIDRHPVRAAIAGGLVAVTAAVALSPVVRELQTGAIDFSRTAAEIAGSMFNAPETSDGNAPIWAPNAPPAG